MDNREMHLMFKDQCEKEPSQDECSNAETM